jgi:inner membrane protein
MPTVGHLALGLAAARLQPGSRGLVPRLALYALLGAAPDLDLVPIALGWERFVPLGHRGATHSLAVAAVVAAAVAFAWPGTSRQRTWLFAFLAMASHGLVDPLVAGSYGPALLWPFTDVRFTWGGFQPLPETPVGPQLLEAFGFLHLAVEAALFAPFAVYALWPRSRSGAARLREIVALPLRAGSRFLPELRLTGLRELRRVQVLATAEEEVCREVRPTGSVRPRA